MNRRRLGRTNFLASEISLGAAEIGMDYGLRPDDARPSPEQAARLLHRALDLGVNFIDTARLYGESEARIGDALADRRGQFFLASKVASFFEENLAGKALRERVTASVCDSLRALRVEVIDLMMIHSAPVEVMLRGEALGILEDLRRDGSIRFTGASVYGEEAALAAIRSGSCDCLQIAYSVLDRRPESRVLREAREHDVGIVARSVLLKGALTHRYRSLPPGLAPLKSAVERLQTLGELPELAYCYVLANEGVHTALVGTARVEELEQAVRCASLGPLPPATLDAIRAVSFADESLLNPAAWPLR